MPIYLFVYSSSSWQPLSLPLLFLLTATPAVDRISYQYNTSSTQGLVYLGPWYACYVSWRARLTRAYHTPLYLLTPDDFFRNRFVHNQGAHARTHSPRKRRWLRKYLAEILPYIDASHGVFALSPSRRENSLELGNYCSHSRDGSSSGICTLRRISGNCCGKLRIQNQFFLFLLQ